MAVRRPRSRPVLVVVRDGLTRRRPLFAEEFRFCPRRPSRVALKLVMAVFGAGLGSPCPFAVTLLGRRRPYVARAFIPILLPP